MADKFVMSARQAAELDHAFERNGWTPADVKQLSGGDILAHLLPFVRKYGETMPVVVQHIIDCDAKPFEPRGLTVASESDQMQNRVRVQFVFDPARVRIHFSPNQQGGKYVKGYELRKELAGESVLPANVLDFYRANPDLIPEEWKGKVVFFWGTIYRGSDGDLYVRYLCFYDGRWCSNYRRLDGDWGGSRPAALRAS